MIRATSSFVLVGADAEVCSVEVDLSPHGLPTMGIVGLPDAAVRESAERVRTAVRNSGLDWPRSRLTVNLAPADLRKEGPVYDLPIAVATLACAGLVPDPADGGRILSNWFMGGELALDGTIRPVRGLIALAVLARRRGATGVVVPIEAAREVSLVPGIEVFGARDLREVLDFLARREHPQAVPETPRDPEDESRRASDGPPIVVGQSHAVRAIEVAAAGGHNLLLSGPPGCGKTLLARSLRALLPSLTEAEAIEVAMIRSAVGFRCSATDLAIPPFRSPHHTSSAVALVGGGTHPRPGEVSLAHRGVLLLDEVAELSRAAIDALREPLEDGRVTIARAAGAVTMPASGIVVATMNPDRSRRGRRGSASIGLDRLGGPMLDRFDLQVELEPTPIERFLDEPTSVRDHEASRSAVSRARGTALARQGTVNAELSGSTLDDVTDLARRDRRHLVRAVADLELSARAFERIRRLARTIADLEGEVAVQRHHLDEAIGLRMIDRAERFGRVSST